MSDNYSIVTDVNAGNSLAVLDQIVNKVMQVESAIGKASGQKLQIDASGSNNVLSGLSSQLFGSKGNFANVGRELGQSLQMGMQQQFGMAGGVASSFAGALGGVGIAAVAGLAGLAALGAASTQAAMKWEDMKTSIGRTTGLKGDNLEELMSQLQDLRQEFGVTAEAASSMVEQAGSIGVGQSKLSVGDMSGYKQEILDFTKATAILQGAWGMSAEATSSGIGKMGSVTLGAWNIQRKARGEEEMSWADYAYKVGGTTDNLANAMGSSEEEIVTAMRNASGAIAKFAPSEETYGKWQAMASFLIDTGSSAGEAGTQIERVAQKMDQNGADIAKVMGIDQASLSTSLKTDFMGTVQDLGEAIAAMPESARPDTAKMFGLEGKVLIDKVVADIEAGTGKLQNAYDLALKPGNVAAGYEDVADNASKAFDRIGQAFQVSLEKIGGQLLPLVADFANGIADAWVSANEAGTEFFDDMQKKLKSSDSIINAGGGLTDAFSALFGGQVSEENLRKIEDFEKRKAEREAKAAADAEAAAKAETARRQAEYEQTTQYGIGEKALSGASFAGASYKDLGVKSGIGYVDALSNELNSALPSAFTDAYLKVYDVAGRAGKEAAKSFAEEIGKSDALYDELTKAKVSKEIASARAYGGVASDEDALAMINASGRTVKADQILSSTSMGLPGLDEYVQNTWLEYHGGRSDTMTAFFDSSGKQLSKTFAAFTEEERDAAYDAFVDGIQPGIKDSARYFKSHASDFKDTVTSIWEDGAISGTEKLTAGGMARALETLKIKFPMEFEEANLQGTLDDLQLLADGKPIKLGLDTDELESTFALWLANRAPIHEAIKKQTGVVPIESSEEALYKYLKTAPKEVQDVYAGIEKATTGSYIDVESLPELIDDMGRLAPELLGYVSVQNDIATATENYRDQVRQTGNGFVVLDKEGNTLANAHLRTSVATQILSGGLIDQAARFVSLASATSAATSALSSLANMSFNRSNPANSYWDTSKNTPNLPSYKQTYAKYTPISMASSFYGLDNLLPKLATGGKVTSGGLAWIGEAGTEYVIPESEIKGLYPESAKVDMGSINYKPFLDYPAPEIRSPSSYRWSHYPDAPNVQELNTEAIQTAWLSDNQLNSRDIYSGLIRQMQLANIGNSLVQPWFARGETEQPKRWSDAATKLSPQYKENWEATKGGTVPSISMDVAATSGVTAIAARNGTTVADAWAQLYGESFTEGCIGTNAPDASLQFTPSASLISEIGRTWGEDTTAAWNQLYGEAFTEGCIGTNKPDSLLKYTPSAKMLAEAARAQGGAWGSQVVGSPATQPGMGDKLITLSSDALSIAKKQLDISENIAKNTNKLDILSMGIFETQSSLTKFPSISGSAMPGDALVTGLSKDGYVVTYDPRTDTCEGLAFNPPDPSLKTTDKFYLGITAGNLPNESYDEGYGWGGKVAWTDNPELAKIQQGIMQSYKEQQQTAKDTAKIEQNTKDMADGLGTVAGGVQGGVLGALVALYGSGGGSGAMNSSGSFGGSYGSLFGDWYGGGAAGLSSYLGTGSSASWMNAAATNIGGSGAIQWAEGGITDRPTYGVFGEAGREAFVPISDRAAGLRILPQVMRELGVRTFASGGIAGSGSGIVATGYKFGDSPSIIYSPTINGVGISMDELQMVLERDHKKLLKAVAKKDILARRRRG